MLPKQNTKTCFALCSRNFKNKTTK